MKKLFLWSFVLIILIPAYLIAVKSRQILSPDKNFSPVSTRPTTHLTALPDNLQKFEITFAQQQLVIYLVEIEKFSKVSLIPNFTRKENGLTSVEKNSCKKAVNGGFYTPDGKPLGLFLTEEREWGKAISSNLATGFFFQEKNGQRFISKIKPENFSGLDFILQTGPLITVGDYQLKLVSDEKTRRMLLALDKSGRLYIISVSGKDNSFDGPFLSDLPQIFNLEEIQRRLVLTTLLNLDGGAASYFYVSDAQNKFSLSEITPVGSFLCVK